MCFSEAERVAGFSQSRDFQVLEGGDDFGGQAVIREGEGTGHFSNGHRLSNSEMASSHPLRARMDFWRVRAGGSRVAATAGEARGVFVTRFPESDPFGRGVFLASAIGNSTVEPIAQTKGLCIGQLRSHGKRIAIAISGGFGRGRRGDFRGVVGAGIEPATNGLWARLSYQLLDPTL